MSFRPFIYMLLLLGGSAWAQLSTVTITRPGASGMWSTLGAGEHNAEQLRYALNVTRQGPGIIRPRHPIRVYGTEDNYCYGAYGYYNPYTQRKLIVGIKDSLYSWYGTDTVGGDTLPRLSLVGQLFVSDTFATNIVNGVPGYCFPLGDNVYHDWTTHRDMLILCDGHSTPLIFTTSQALKYMNSIPDTAAFQPRTISLGLEAPGQLRVGLTDLKGSLDGAYQYSYAFLDTAVDSCSRPALWSAEVYPDGELPYITHFDGVDENDVLLILRKKLDGRALTYIIDTIYFHYPGDTIKSALIDWNSPTGHGYRDLYADAPYTYYIIIGDDTASYAGEVNTYFPDALRALRDSINTEMTTWSDSLIAIQIGHGISINADSPCVTFVIAETDTLGTVIYRTDYPTDTMKQIVYVDTIHDTMATVLWNEANVDTTVWQPGRLQWGAYDNYVDTSTTSWYAYPDSLYNVAYSYYDPVTKIESPLGPSLYTSITQFNGDSAQFRTFSIMMPADARQEWVRFYQGVTKTGLTGAGDTTYWYLLFEARTDGLSLEWGMWADSHVTTGLDTSMITTDTIYDWQVPVDINGDVIVQPPYRYATSIPFSDMCHAHDRFYGIGHPKYLNRIYFSGIDTVWDWNPLNYVRVQEGVADEFVALKELHDVLYAFKHNSIWYLPGFSSEYETQWGRLIDTDIEFRQLAHVGTATNKTIVQVGGAVYFLTPQAEVYRFNSQGLMRISDPIDNWLDTLFATRYTTITDSARLIVFGDAVKLQNNSQEKRLSYNVLLNYWSLESYDVYPNPPDSTDTTYYVPIGSFQYDSTEGTGGFAHYLMFTDSGTYRSGFSPGAFCYENAFDSWQDQEYDFPWAFECYAAGDGLNLWQVQQINGTILWRGASLATMWLHYTVYNEDGDSLCSDSLYNTTMPQGGVIDLRWDVQQHEPAKYCYVRLWTRPDDVDNLVWFDDVSFVTRMVGRNEAK